MAALTPITFDRIKEIADEQGYSLRTINNVAELGTNTIYGWKFKEPTIDHVEAVANVLGVSVNYLLGYTDSRDNSVETLPLEFTEIDTDMEEIVALIESAGLSKLQLQTFKRLIQKDLTQFD
ncbi:helix-turn-helix domain-containing protein [Weissella cibaria]|uniref:helix-turn-helix domain-containing protein n=1 Tax=Weissella cibaria TaxID=137591 RepID=UPI00223BC61D|nr:XRE family transcriptional regulator [Weissella cibaria]MCT0021060.1 XRE family transcriptional regulator [Weissella cibaria]